MLQIATDAKIEQETEDSLGGEIYCAGCGHVITHTQWKISRGASYDQGHEHVFFNPAGLLFRIVCFKEAPGVAGQGDPSGEFTWFKGYRWQISACLGCSAHLGWQFSRDEDVFFGLIKPLLTTEKKI